MLLSLLSYTGIVATIYLVFSFNPIVNLAILITIFIVSALLFIQLEFYFLGLTYIIVYVGAIAVLFLFVIMMVSTKVKLKQTMNLGSTKLAILLILQLLLIALLLNLDTTAPYYFFYYPNWLNDVTQITDLQSIGFTLFLANPVPIILISFLLWLVLIGVLSVTQESQ